MNWQNRIEYNLPEGWCAEQTGDNLFLYDADGEGAITISSFRIIDKQKPQIDTVLNLFQDFITQNGISMDAPAAAHYYVGSKLITTGTGKTCDQWFIKIWCLSQCHRILLATYLAEKITEETAMCDQIIHSIEFTL